MKKRLFKKKVKTMSDEELNEHVAYCESKRKDRILMKEFDKRFEIEYDDDSFSIDEYFENFAEIDAFDQ